LSTTVRRFDAPPFNLDASIDRLSKLDVLHPHVNS
jgi:hypothetical protein